MAINFAQLRDCLKEFDFQKLFVRELGWSQPANKAEAAFEVKGQPFTRRQVAQLAGVAVLEVTAQDGRIPDAKTRAAIDREIAKSHHEHVIIFLDHERTQSLWYWVKRQDGKLLPRDHLYVKGQPGDLFVSKLGQIVFDLADFDAEGNVSIIEVAKRLRSALDVERAVKKFFGEFQEQHLAFLDLIQGVRDERDRRWYASVLLNRLMFIYFLQRKGFVDGGDIDYLQRKLTESRGAGRNRFFSGFLKLLFFEGFAKPDEKRSPEARASLGQIKYLNGGLFLPHHVEQRYPKLDVPDKAFENLFALFGRYSWNLNDTPGGDDNEMNPDVLGYIFEKYINQKAFGAYYTRPEITEYLCERTIHRLVLDAVNTPEAVLKHPPAGLKPRHYETLAELLMDLDAPLCKRLLREVLPQLSLLDPACGSGAFLVAAMKTLIGVYAAVIGKIKFLADRELSQWLAKTEKAHPSLNYFIKKSIITDNLYGVDIMEEAVEIAKLRLFLALVAAAETVEQLEPLPNIDFNILAGNSLIGLMRVDDADFEGRAKQGNLFRKSYKQVLAEKNKLIDDYRHHAAYTEDLTALRDQIEEKKRQSLETLDDILLDEFNHLGIKFEQATWDIKANKAGKPVKRSVKPQDIEALRPFHWGFEFDEIINSRGGFDAIITNPPWEIFKPYSKEFFQDYSDLVTKKNMTIHDFEKHQGKLLKDEDIREAWLSYLSAFPHVSAYFRSAAQFKNQISVVNGKKAGTDINLYKLFVEQCFNLLRAAGRCGIITPGGIYTDLGSKQLRQMLFAGAEVTSLFGLSNEKFIFEAVHHAQKFCLLVFKKGRATGTIEAAFRINPRDAVSPERLDAFLHEEREHLRISAALIRRLSPDSISVMEFKSERAVEIAEKLAAVPFLGDVIDGSWNIQLSQEMHMTNDSDLFKESPKKNDVPLVQGNMIHQFNHAFGDPKYWVDLDQGRARILGRHEDTGQRLAYQSYRFVHRRIASSTNERTAIACVMPPNYFCGDTAQTTRNVVEPADLMFLTAVFNSFVADWEVRQRVTAHLDMHFVYKMRIPRLTSKDKAFAPVVERASLLVCTVPAFDALAKEVGLKNHKDGVTNVVARGRLRAELDGLIAHVYGLTEDDFTYILTAFPLVPDPVKVAAHNAYRDVERGLIS